MKMIPLSIYDNRLLTFKNKSFSPMIQKQVKYMICSATYYDVMMPIKEVTRFNLTAFILSNLNDKGIV